MKPIGGTRIRIIFFGIVGTGDVLAKKGGMREMSARRAKSGPRRVEARRGQPTGCVIRLDQGFRYSDLVVANFRGHRISASPGV